jgi:hypothetical protein
MHEASGFGCASPSRDPTISRAKYCAGASCLQKCLSRSAGEALLEYGLPAEGALEKILPVNYRKCLQIDHERNACDISYMPNKADLPMTLLWSRRFGGTNLPMILTRLQCARPCSWLLIGSADSAGPICPRPCMAKLVFASGAELADAARCF